MMRANLKVILAAVGAVALLASPAMAKTVQHSKAAAAASASPSDAHASAAPYSTYGVANEGGPYTPSKPAPASGKNNDFQDGAR
jgi:hypothetical protein